MAAKPTGKPVAKPATGRHASGRPAPASNVKPGKDGFKSGGGAGSHRKGGR